MSTADDPLPPDVTPELPSSAWRLMLAALGRLPQGLLSRGFGRLADLPLPGRVRRPVLGAFARAFGIDVAEAEHPLEEYPTLGAFFVRRLRPGLRGWPEDPARAASPVDGVVGHVGEVADGRAVQAKGRRYSVAELLDDATSAARFEGGVFVTLYLSPRHYHRIHAPWPGMIPRARHVPGALLPVNAAAVAHVPDLFARNERLVCYVDGAAGRAAVVAVGAYNVGRISAAFDVAWNAPRGGGTWVTNRPGAVAATHEYDPPVEVGAGEEIMAFHLGSTVVLLFERGRVELAPGIVAGAEVRVGEAMGGPPRRAGGSRARAGS